MNHLKEIDMDIFLSVPKIKFLRTPKNTWRHKKSIVLKIIKCVTSTTRVKFLSSFGRMVVRQEMLKKWKDKEWSIFGVITTN